MLEVPALVFPRLRALFCCSAFEVRLRYVLGAFEVRLRCVRGTFEVLALFFPCIYFFLQVNIIQPHFHSRQQTQYKCHSVFKGRGKGEASLLWCFEDL